MPYRRLPNTDNARVKALQTAYQKGKEIPPFKLAFSQNALQKVQSFLPGFEKRIMEQKQAYTNQVKRNKEYLAHMKKARLYISHFIQVLNMAILRGDIPAAMRIYFNIDENDKRVPALTTEQDIIEWGEKIINGEARRTQKGMSPITNPTIAVVKVRYENFVEAYQNQKTLQKNNTRALNELAAMRPEADEIITQIWDEVEKSFNDLPEDLKREKATDYGIAYVYRKNEISRIKFFEPTKLSFG